MTASDMHAHFLPDFYRDALFVAGLCQAEGTAQLPTPRYNLLFREVERELFPLAQEEGLAVIPFNPLAGGLLSGKYKHGDRPKKGRFSVELGGFGKSYHARYWHEREFETVARVQEIAKQHGTPITTLSVAWVLANPAITSVILRASRVEQLIGRRGLQTRQRIENEAGRSQHRISQGRRRKVRKRWR